MSGGALRRLAAASLLVAAAGVSVLSPPSSAATRSPLAAPAQPAPSSVTIIIPKDARTSGYQTPNVSLAQGGTLNAVNFDDIQHTVTALDHGADGKPLFDTLVPPGSTVSVPAASKLAAGVYRFECQFHQLKMQGTLTIEGGDGTGVTPVPPNFEQPLFRPPVLTDSHIRIPVKPADVQVLPHGAATRMWTYGGTYPGPTIVRPAGHDTKVTFVNKLPKSAGAMTIHLHGDHHASSHDGQPSTHLVKHGDARTYDYPLKDGGKPERAASLFYHDHRMGLTGRNVWRGLQGMFLINDGKAADLRLPRGKFDIPLLISNRTFTTDNQLTDPFPHHPAMELTGPTAPPDDATVGQQILANGRFAPYLKVSTHRYRLRLVNGSNFTSYDFTLSDGRPFVQIATGNGLLPKPVVRQDVLLGPAQRADVIVDFQRELDDEVLLQSQPRTDDPPPGSIGTPTAAIMQFRVTRSTTQDSTRIPATLQPAPKIDPPSKVTKTWRFDVAGNKGTGSYWTINGKPFDPDRIDARVPLGSTQTWKLHNASPITHFIHLHEEQWHTVSRNGGKPLPWERGLEDTWKLDPGETVVVAAHFTDHTGVFMLHCHMLDHEDHGLMAQFKVVRPARAAATNGTVLSPALITSATAAPAGGARIANALLNGLAARRPVAPLPASDDFMCGPEKGKHDDRSALISALAGLRPLTF